MLQAAFRSMYGSHEEILADHQRNVEVRLKGLTREIVESNVRTKLELDSMYGKIVSNIVLRSGLGNPTNRAVLRETTVVLQSVFPQQDLPRFLAQPKLDKRAQLKELTSIVAGIRIFNWDSKKGGAGIEDLPAVLSSAVDATLANMEAMRTFTGEKIDHFTAAVEKLLYTDLGALFPDKDRLLFKSSLVNLRQFQIYLTLIYRDIQLSGQRLSNLDAALLSHLTDIQKSLASKLAVPTAKVFPQFIRLAKTWQGFQEEMLVLSKLSSLQQSIHGFTKCLKRVPLKETMTKLKVSSAPSDEERWEEGSQGSMEDEKTECEVIYPGQVEGYDKLEKVLAGFCPVALVSGHGFVLPGNPRIGLLNYDSKLYSISTVERAKQFVKNPTMFVSAIKKLLYENPTIATLLNFSTPQKTPANKLQVESGEEKRQLLAKASLNSFLPPSSLG